MLLIWAIFREFLQKKFSETSPGAFGDRAGFQKPMELMLTSLDTQSQVNTDVSLGALDRLFPASLTSIIRLKNVFDF